MHIRPVYWNYDFSLYLYPLPHLVWPSTSVVAILKCVLKVILGDKYDKYENNYKGCRFANPGVFGSEFCFAEWYPATDEFNFLSVAPEDEEEV